MPSPAELKGLRAQPVRTQDDAWRMALIRNECRAGFSGHTEIITREQQEAWWQGTRGRVQAWLFCAADGALVGFGLLRPLNDPDGPLTTTVAVLPKHAGQGYGKAITSDLVERADDRMVEARARLDNPAAVALHVPEYWYRVQGPDPSLAYFRAIPEEVRQATAEWAAYYAAEAEAVPA
jgi:GNAT superfamily N-acetyltransferase